MQAAEEMAKEIVIALLSKVAMQGSYLKTEAKPLGDTIAQIYSRVLEEVKKI